MTTPAPFDVNTALRAVLEATRDKVAAARRIDLWRDRLDREARRRYAEEQSAPAWNTPQLGKVRLDPKPARPHVADDDTFAAYVLGISPDNVTATIELAGADLDEALTALDFAGIKVTRSTATVRPAYLGPFLDSLLVEDDVVLRDVDGAGTVETVPGVGITPPSATLVVTIDPALKRETLARVDHELDTPPEETLAGALDTVADELHTIDTTSAPTAADEAHAADVGAALMASAAARGLPLEPASGIAPDLAARQRAHAAARAAAITDAPPYTARPGMARPSDPATSPHHLTPATPEDVLTSTILEGAYKADSLKRACRRLTLSATGSKADLAARLHNARVTSARMKELTAP